MRDGVVHVEQLQPLSQDHLVLLRRQREGIGEMVEQRIPAHPGIDLMEEDALGVSPQPKR